MPSSKMPSIDNKITSKYVENVEMYYTDRTAMNVRIVRKSFWESNSK